MILYSRKSLYVGTTIFIIICPIFIYLSPNYITNADSAVYSQIIINHDFNSISIHLGYYFLGLVFSSILPLSIDYSLNIMNCFFGALSVVLIYYIGITISGKNIVGVISSLFLATNFVFVFNSIYAEVYISQTFFLLLAIQLWLLNKPIFTGMTFTLSFLISPSSVFAIPLLVALRPNITSLIKFTLPVFLISILALFPYVNDYLFGNRGLLVVSKADIYLKSAINKEFLELFLGFYVYIPFLLAGTIQVFKLKRYLILGIGIFSMWVVSFTFGETTSDVPVQLPTYALLCLVGGIGFNSLIPKSSKGKNGILFWFLTITILSILLILVLNRGQNQLSLEIIWTFVFAIFLYTLLHFIFEKVIFDFKGRSFILFGVLALFIGLNSNLIIKLVKKTRNDYNEFRGAIIEMNKIADSDYLVVGKFAEGALFEYYIFEAYLTGRWICTEWLFGIGAWGKQNQIRARKEWRNAIETNREIWILTDEFPSLFNDLRQAGYSIENYKNFYCARPG